jgi:hypothetical protein
LASEAALLKRNAIVGAKAPSLLKKEALYFDELMLDYDERKKIVDFSIAALRAANPALGEYMVSVFSKQMKEIEFLVDSKILVPYSFLDAVREHLTLAPVDPSIPEIKFQTKGAAQFSPDKNFLDEFSPLFTKAISDIWEQEKGPKKVVIESKEAFNAEMDRVFANVAQKMKLIFLLKNWLDSSALFVPVFNKNELSGSESLLNEQIATELIIKRFPQPSDSVTWQEIIEFRSDSEHASRLMDLRHWVTKLSRTNLSRREIEEEIDWLVHDYERLLKLHKVAYEMSQLELVVVNTLEVVENLIKLNWSAAAKTIFALGKQKTDYQIQTSGLNGRELAYIADAKEAFGTQQS